MAYTKTQQRIINTLADGKMHSREEILSCISEDVAEKSTMHVHMNKLRKILNPIGEEIVCRVMGYRHMYQHVRLLNPQSASTESNAQDQKKVE